MLTALLALTTLQALADEGTFVIRQDTVEVAREVFRFAPGRLSAGGTGWVMASTVRYAGARPVVVLSPILELSADSAPLTLQYDVADPAHPVRILGQLGRGRFTVRVLARAFERAREFPAPTRTVVLDDSVFAFYQIAAAFALADPSPLTVIVPRGERRESLTIQDLGTASTVLNRAPAQLRHLVLTGGANQQVDLWLAADGRLLKLDILSRHVVVERAPSP